MARGRTTHRRRRGRFSFLLRLLCTALVIAAVIGAVTLFFKAETIAVEGNRKYTEQEVIEAAGLHLGDNLYLMNKYDHAQAIFQNLPYVESASINRKLPDTLLIEVKECPAAASVPAEGGARFSEDNGATWQFLPNDTIVSMNLWCFRPSMLEQTRKRFSKFLLENLPVNPLKCEYYLPSVPDACIRDGEAKVRLLSTDEKWFGMTYREDLPLVRESIADMKCKGVYPERLWR